MASRHEARQVANRILLALGPDGLDRIWPHLERVDLSFRQVVLHSGYPVKHAYFVEHGYVSLLRTMSDGRAVEVSGIGKEGLVGLCVVHDVARTIFDGVVQIPGSALRIKSETLGHQIARDVRLRELALRYSFAATEQIAQTAACNRLHSVKHRCARWLLLSHDSAEADTFPLTHELLATMLGVQRPGLSVVLKSLQQSGLIRTTRGHVTVTDRAGLERMSCECYRTIRREIDEVFVAGKDSP